MKAITVQQPWAELIASGTKLVENRSQGWAHVGELAIHAGQAYDDSAPLDPLVRNALGITDENRFERRRDHVERGEVIAVATLTGCHRADGTCCAPWGRYGDRVHHLVLADVRRLNTPVPARGALGLWTLPPEVEAAVEMAVPR